MNYRLDLLPRRLQFQQILISFRDRCMAPTELFQWVGYPVPLPAAQGHLCSTHGSNTSCMLFQIAFPPMMIVSCVVSSRRQPPGSHCRVTKRTTFRFQVY